MKLSDISIGSKFTTPAHGGPVYSWQITDIGSRVVVAIRVKEGWMNGPPYALQETVFDEDDLPVCEREVKT